MAASMMNRPSVLFTVPDGYSLVVDENNKPIIEENKILCQNQGNMDVLNYPVAITYIIQLLMRSR